MNKQTIVIGAALAMALVFILAANSYRSSETERVEEVVQESAATLVPEHAMTVGPDDARVTIVEFFDPACETCATFHKPVKQLVAAHPGQVRLVLRYLPLHEGSQDVVKMLEAARKQGKYWEALEMMFASQRAWASHHDPKPELLWELLPRVGVDVAQARADVGDFQLDALIQQDLEDAAKLGLRKTPGFLVNGKPLPSFGFQQLQILVNSEIAANY